MKTAPVDISQKELGDALKKVFVLLPIPALVIAIVNIYLGSYLLTTMMMGLVIFCTISYLLISSGRLYLSVYSLIVVGTIVTAISCIIGVGIHETAIVAFPVIVLFSSFVLNGKGVTITTVFVLFGLAIVTFGEQFGYYPSRPVNIGRTADLIVVIAILTMCLFITYYLSQIYKRSLQKTREEIINQTNIQSEIQTNLQEKTQLLREVHHRVKNNLSLINSMIGLEITDPAKLSSINNHIQSIARVHDPLFQSMNYQEIQTRSFLEKIIASFSISSSEGVDHLSLEVEDIQLSTESAIPVGVILYEVLRQLDFRAHAYTITVRERARRMHLEIASKTDRFSNMSQKFDLQLVELMLEELQARLIEEEHAAMLSFNK